MVAGATACGGTDEAPTADEGPPSEQETTESPSVSDEPTEVEPTDDEPTEAETVPTVSVRATCQRLFDADESGEIGGLWGQATDMVTEVARTDGSSWDFITAEQVADDLLQIAEASPAVMRPDIEGMAYVLSATDMIETGEFKDAARLVGARCAPFARDFFEEPEPEPEPEPPPSQSRNQSRS